MRSVHCCLLFFLVVLGCGSTIVTPNPDSFTWKQIDFVEATNNKLRPVELEFSIPKKFETRFGGNLNLGSIWGTKEDIDAGLTGAAFDFTKTKQGVFRIFVSMNTAYDVDKDEFTGESEMQASLKLMGAKDVKNSRTSFGGYPGMVTTAKLNGKLMFSCHIATLNSTNVITILYHTPFKLTGHEFELWHGFINSIRRPAYKKHDVRGVDATQLLASIVEGSKIVKPTKLTLTIHHVVGPPSAAERPEIKQTIEMLEDHTGPRKLDVKVTATNKLVVKMGVNSTDTQMFGPPWNSPPFEITMAINEEHVSGDFRIDSKSVQKIEQMPVEEFRLKNSTAYGVLSGAPVTTTVSHDQFVKEFLDVFDFKLTPGGELVGTPNRKKILAMMDDVDMPYKVRGMSIADELMKRWAKAQVIFDRESNRFLSLSVTGMMMQQPFVIELSAVQAVVKK